MFDVNSFRRAFPYFQQQDKAIYLDNAATTLKPQILLERTIDFYQSAGSVHRSQYDAQNTQQYEQARLRVAKWINAESADAVIWTSGTTQAINTVANGMISHLTIGDEIIISQAEHHANFVPWLALAEKCGVKIQVLPLLANGLIDEDELKQKLNGNTKLVALNMISNVTGIRQPVEQFLPIIRRHSDALVLIDCAQAINHSKLDLAELDADFIAFSAHKIYGPTGLGVLSGKLASLNLLQPLQYGGKMVDKVSLKQISYAPLPYRLEAGTPNIAGVIGFNGVLEWLAQWDMQQAQQYVQSLVTETKIRLQDYANCRLWSGQNSNIISFSFVGIHNSDLATLLAEQGIALRSGQHCAQPYLEHLQQDSTLRISFAPYNSKQDVEQFFMALDNSLAMLAD